MSNQIRPLFEVARDIKKSWLKPNPSATPYLDAMLQLDSIDSNYGVDTGQSIVIYFLANASTFRGEEAKRLKNELKQLLKK